MTEERLLSGFPLTIDPTALGLLVVLARPFVASSGLPAHAHDAVEADARICKLLNYLQTR